MLLHLFGPCKYRISTLAGTSVHYFHWIRFQQHKSLFVISRFKFNKILLANAIRTEAFHPKGCTTKDRGEQKENGLRITFKGASKKEREQSKKWKIKFKKITTGIEFLSTNHRPQEGKITRTRVCTQSTWVCSAPRGRL